MPRTTCYRVAPGRENSGTSRVVYSMLAAMLVALSTGCDRPQPRPVGPPKKISIGVSTWPASAALYVARDKGFFKNAGIDATLAEYSSGHLAINDVVSGKIDFATATETPIASAALEGKPLAVVATLSYIERAIVIVGRKDRGIAAASDLTGKRVAITPGTAGDFYLHIYLTTFYIDPAHVTIVGMPAGTLADELAAGNVDAVCTWAPYSFAAQEKLGSNAVVLNEPELYTMMWNLVVARDLIVRDPDAIVRALRAFIMANNFIREHAFEAMAIVARDIGIDKEKITNQWSDYSFTAELGRNLLMGLEDQARWHDKRMGGVGQSPNFLDYIHTGSLKAIQPDAVRLIRLSGGQ